MNLISNLYLLCLDRLGFLTTMGLSIMILISMVTSVLPNASEGNDEPLIMMLYKTAMGAYAVQMFTVLVTDAMSEWRFRPWQYEVAPMDQKLCDDGPHVFKDLVVKMEQIRQLLDTDSEDKYGEYWKRMSCRLNFCVCGILLAVEIGVVGYFFKEIEKSEALTFF